MCAPGIGKADWFFTKYNRYCGVFGRKVLRGKVLGDEKELDGFLFLFLFFFFVFPFSSFSLEFFVSPFFLLFRGSASLSLVNFV